MGQLEQIEFLGPADSRPAIIDPQFVENAFGVGAKGVERDDQSAGNFGAVNLVRSSFSTSSSRSLKGSIMSDF